MKKEIEIKITPWPEGKAVILLGSAYFFHKGNRYSVALDQSGLNVTDDNLKRTITLKVDEVIISILDEVEK